MQKYLWGGAALLVAGAAAVYVGTDYAGRHPKSFLGRVTTQVAAVTFGSPMSLVNRGLTGADAVQQPAGEVAVVNAAKPMNVPVVDETIEPIQLEALPPATSEPPSYSPTEEAEFGWPDFSTGALLRRATPVEGSIPAPMTYADEEQDCYIDLSTAFQAMGVVGRMCESGLLHDSWTAPVYRGMIEWLPCEMASGWELMGGKPTLFGKPTLPLVVGDVEECDEPVTENWFERFFNIFGDDTSDRADDNTTAGEESEASREAERSYHHNHYHHYQGGCTYHGGCTYCPPVRVQPAVEIEVINEPVEKPELIGKPTLVGKPVLVGKPELLGKPTLVAKAAKVSSSRGKHQPQPRVHRTLKPMFEEGYLNRLREQRWFRSTTDTMEARPSDPGVSAVRGFFSY